MKNFKRCFILEFKGISHEGSDEYTLTEKSIEENLLEILPSIVAMYHQDKEGGEKLELSIYHVGCKEKEELKDCIARLKLLPQKKT